MALVAADTTDFGAIACGGRAHIPSLASRTSRPSFPVPPLAPSTCPRLPQLRRCSLLDTAKEGVKEVARGSLQLEINKMSS